MAVKEPNPASLDW